jgi:adenylyltransferase/sulfurtransferase
MEQEYSISPQEVRDRLESGEPLLLLDVREDWEYAVAHIPDSIHIPLGQLPTRIGELSSEAEMVVLCHHGIRGMNATAFLVKQGFTQVKNMTGGIDLYSQVDPTIPRYR